jgi:hypothetical protein
MEEEEDEDEERHQDCKTGQLERKELNGRSTVGSPDWGLMGCGLTRALGLTLAVAA